jgi:hypothetical protein
MSTLSYPERVSCISDAALGYLARGWGVIPVEPAGKRPLVAWEGFQRHAPGPDQVRAWWRTWPDANVAIVTGSGSSLVVLDIDPRHAGGASLVELERRHGAFPPTIEALTGGGGRHLYFAHPGGVVRNRVGLAAGIDLRGDGGLVVAPPSLHASGHHYRWADGRAPEEATLRRLPGWLRVLGGDEQPGRGHPRTWWRKLLREGVAAGERNNAIASLTGHLLVHGIDPDVALELLLCWNRQRCRPPLPDDEVARTVESIKRTQQRHAREREREREETT